MRIQATNFQAWSSFDLEIDGLTVIVGPSNIGKSAVHRAIKAALRNELGEHHLKRGEQSVTVKIAGDGHEVHAERLKSGKVNYVVDGVSFSKLNRDLPPPMKSWGFEPIQVGTSKLDVAFARQFDNQFLVSSTPAELNAVLGMFASTTKLDAGRKKLREKIQSSDAEAKVHAQTIRSKEEELLELGVTISEGDALQHLLHTLLDEAETLDTASSSIGEVVSSFSAITKIKKMLTALNPPKELDQTKTLVDAATNAEIAATSAIRIAALKSALSSSKKAQDLLADANYTALMDVQFLIRSNLKTLSAVVDAIEACDLSQASTAVRSVVAVEALKNIVPTLTGLKKDLKAKTKELDTTQAQAQKLNDKIVSASVKCPKCGHLIERSA